MVPLADSTICEWNNAANSRAVLLFHPDASSGILLKSKLGWTRGERHRCDAPNIPMSASAVPVRSERGISLDEKHRTGNENWHVFLARHQRVGDARQSSENVPALHLMFCFVATP